MNLVQSTLDQFLTSTVSKEPVKYWSWNTEPEEKILVQYCPSCKGEYIVQKDFNEDIVVYGFNGTYYKPKKCPSCNIKMKFKEAN